MKLKQSNEDERSQFFDSNNNLSNLFIENFNVYFVFTILSFFYTLNRITVLGTCVWV